MVRISFPNNVLSTNLYTCNHLFEKVTSRLLHVTDRLKDALMTCEWMETEFHNSHTKMMITNVRLFLPLLLLRSTLSTVVKVGYSIEEPGTEDDSPLDSTNFVKYSEECSDKCCWSSFKDRCRFTGYHIVANKWTTYVLSHDNQVIECNKRYHKYHEGSCTGGLFEGETITYKTFQDNNGVIVLDTTNDCIYVESCDACLTSSGTFIFQENKACHIFKGFYQVSHDFRKNDCGSDPMEPSVPSALTSPTRFPTEVLTSVPVHELTARPTKPSLPSPFAVPSPSPTSLPVTTSTPLPTSSPTPPPTCSISNDAEPCSAQV